MANIVIANWKMQPESKSEALKILKGIKDKVSVYRKTDIVICPSFLHLPLLKKEYKGKKISFGVQDIFYEPKGSFTGEISAPMAKESGADYAIIGHSERRILGENDRQVSLKVKQALDAGLTPIVCIGEKERDEGGSYLSFLASQLLDSLSDLSKKNLTKIIIAYEPVWAIGKTATEAISPRELYETSLYLRKVLVDKYGKKDAMEVPIIYGGSVEDSNASSIIAEGGVSGFLVGHASLSPDKFLKIIEAVS